MAGRYIDDEYSYQLALNEPRTRVYIQTNRIPDTERGARREVVLQRGNDKTVIDLGHYPIDEMARQHKQGITELLWQHGYDLAKEYATDVKTAYDDAHRIATKNITGRVLRQQRLSQRGF